MGLDTLYEITKRSIPLAKNDGVYLSWCDSVVCVRTDKGVNFFEFSCNLECMHKELDIYELSLPSPKNSPATELCKSKFIYDEMKNYEYTEMTIDSAFWPHNKTLTQEMTSVSITAWSPPYFIENQTALAILNNIGGIQIVIQRQQRWECILELSESMQSCLEYKQYPSNFEELKTSVYTIESSSLCWAPKLNHDNSCDLVTAQKNGVILFWRIFNIYRAPLLKGQVQCGLLEIKNMLWIQRAEKNIWLICTDIIGQVNVLEIEIEDEEVRLLKSYVLWKHKDRMIASYLNYLILNENVVLLYSKHRHFVVQVLNKNGKVIKEYINNINDYRITDITGTVDGFYLATINVKIFKININVTSNTLSVDLIPIELKEQYSTYELYGICFSKMNAICALGLIDRKLLYRKETFKVDIVFATTDSKLDSLITLFLNNPTEKLTNYWDCIEALRYNINKSKKMPSIDYHSLFAEASTNIYKLKLYLILLTFYLGMRKIARVGTDFTLPELSVNKVKEKILFMHAQSTIETLFKKHKQNGLSTLENETLYGCIKYLELYGKNNKSEIKIDLETLNIVNSDVKYVCQSCDNNILEGFTCKDGHLNMYCILSFTPIADDYLVCKCCKCTARADMCFDNPLCVFCDQHLIKPE